MRKYIFKSTLWDKLRCSLFGHNTHRYHYTNVMEINRNRKGGKKKNRGVIKFKTRHYREFCTRCGLILKKR